jgi:hypothetical protein
MDAILIDGMAAIVILGAIVLVVVFFARRR